ncbi:RNA polymerase sigma-70 factor [Oceanobacillus bengalensis]|nr:RNA polymerase sigma-70 factor [Oceanobacillus bengalensis]
MTQKWDVVIVGSGLAGLIAANYLSKTNLSILILEKGKHIGGRARTKKINQQYFNLGPHALYKRGKAKSILEELGIHLNGKSPKLSGGRLMEDNMEYAAPFSPYEVFTTSYLNWKERMEWVGVLMKVMRINPEKLKNQTFQQWVKQVAHSKKVESLLYILSRLATYCHASDKANAKVIVSNLKQSIGGTLYLDDGWQTIIDQLYNKATLSGVQVQTHTLVKHIAQTPQGHLKIRLSNDKEILGKYVISTTSPHELNEMLVSKTNMNQHDRLAQITPVRGATLDVALSQLPNPKRLFTLGITDPLYYSVHSHYARLSDDTNSTVLHVFKYLHPDDHLDKTKIRIELEQFLDKMQPAWKQYVITSRFIPNMTVNQRLPQIGDECILHQYKADIPGLYIAGDWASDNYMLADGAASSAKQAAKEIILHERRKKMQISKEEYQLFKPLLFSLAYRMLGSVVEAEDIVQETFLGAYQLNEENIKNKKAYLCKMLTNRCLDMLKSARSRREYYVGPWNPEPLILDKLHAFDPSEMIIQKEGLSIAYLRIMEHLTPDERAVLLLREVFAFSYVEIANIIEKREENARKIFSRAKQKVSRIEGESLNYKINKSIIDRFIQAFQTQNTSVLLELISENVTLYSDGGGIVNAATRPIVSPSNVLALLYGIIKKVPKDFYFEVKSVNYQPAIVIFMNETLHSIFSFYIYNERINEIYITMNPEKLPIH